MKYFFVAFRPLSAEIALPDLFRRILASVRAPSSKWVVFGHGLLEVGGCLLVLMGGEEETDLVGLLERETAWRQGLYDFEVNPFRPGILDLPPEPSEGVFI
jgi:hypothetical protein